MAHYTRQKNTDVDMEERALSPTSEALSDSGGGAVSFISPSLKYRIKSTSLVSGRTCLEKVLASLLLVLLVAFILAIVITVNFKRQTSINMYLSHNTGKEKQESVCLSADCVIAAANILSSADLSADPCQDFYQYACGGWEVSNPIPDGKSSWSTFGKLWQENQQILRTILETEPSQQEKSCSSCGKVRLYYESCLDSNKTLEMLGGQPLLEILGDFYWNVTDFDGGGQQDNFTFQKVLTMVQHGFNVGGFFVWNVGEDDKNSSRHVLQIDQGGLTLNAREYYINKTEDDPVIAALLQVMVDTSLLLYKDKKNYSEISDIIKEDVRRQMLDVIEFEMELATITSPPSQNRDEERRYHKYTIQQLQNISDIINWQEYFQYAFLPLQRKIQQNETIIVYSPDYLSNMSKLVKEKLATPVGKNTINNYLMWQLIRNFNGALSSKYVEVDKVLKKALMGTDIHEERWRLCVSDVDNVLGFALGALFVNKTFDGHSKPEAESMIKEITEAFISSLHSADWMDFKTKLLAEHKAKRITNMIGYPDYITNNTALDEKYKQLEINQDYFSNNIRFSKWSLEENLSKLDKKTERDKWGMTPPTINAYYTPTKNQIVFPAGILQMPFFSLKNPRSLNFGAMGVVMGHELSHAFDDQGREYDADGNMAGWWQNKTLIEYKKRVMCIEEQYSEFTLNQEQVNGKQTLGENIADNGGLKASYRAYQNWVNKSGNGEPGLLPGLNLTHNQLFFLSFSQVWCSMSTPQAEHLSLLEDAHSPPRLRVLGTLANSREFASVYQCPLGSRMNPNQTKCDVW